jgi:hypothetical protein
VGILRRDGEPADPRNIDRMLAPMQHRGPDGRGDHGCCQCAACAQRRSNLALVTYRREHPSQTQPRSAISQRHSTLWPIKSKSVKNDSLSWIA